MRSIRRLAVIAVVTVAGALCMPATVPAAQNLCEPPHWESPEYYNFIHTYKTECASKQNYDRTFPDVTASRMVDGHNQLSVTTSTALAGAIASVKVNGKEFIASGAKGTAFQYAFHAWNEGGAPSECYNPTQAGARIEVERQRAPFHGPSTSALYTHAGTGSSIRTEARPAMFMTRDDPVLGWGDCLAANYQPDRSPFTMGLSPYWLKTEIQLGLRGLDNVFRLGATITSDDDPHDHFDGVTVAYLQRDFTEVYSYELADGTTTLRPPASHASKDPMMRCTSDSNYCLGLYIKPAAVAAGDYYYTMTRPPSSYNGMLGEATIQVDSRTTSVNGGDTIGYETFVAVGNKDRVSSTFAALHRAFGQTS
ncbi:hypothetical protein LWC34_50485 [Kibdelosporangium philippinense]|uniref:Secreted protein n=1 Tax=Kibdelosporangium philippinense TaxID=211113 RepID=A0ABS8ZTF3_9PSEU|nr:hypothetical protein [Kibdelosporangium philippinense]MCE7010981.1 hypothetical protein [Kibdelosporangium philippinense]